MTQQAKDLKVFVYGTLKPGGHYWPEFCEGKVVAQMPAKVQGELYDLHVGYPGLRLRGDAWVYGYVLELGDLAHLHGLDYLEGYVPERPEGQNEYNRLRVPCFDRDGESLGEVWAYEVTASTLTRTEGSLVASGDWPV